MRFYIRLYLCAMNNIIVVQITLLKLFVTSNTS